MDSTDSISSITYKWVHPGLYVVVFADEKIGTLRGDYSTGFWAYLNNGTQLAGTYSLPHEAAEVLSLEVSLRACDA